MPDIKEYIGTGGTGDFDVAADWNPAGVPANGDSIRLTRRALCDLLVNLTQAGKNFELISEPGYIKKFGQSGSPFKPDSITNLRWESSGDQCWLDTKIIQGSINCESIREDSVSLAATTAGDENQRLVIHSGKVNLATSFQFADGAQLSLTGPNAKVVLPIGVTMGTGHRSIVDAGLLLTDADLGTITMRGGRAVLQGVAAAALVEMYGPGQFVWASSGDIDEAIVIDGDFDAQTFDYIRELTFGSGKNPGVARIGHNTACPNGWKKLDGIWAPRYPFGTAVYSEAPP